MSRIGLDLARSWLTNTRSASRSGSSPRSHTCSSSQSWVRSTPGAEASASSSRHSVGVRWTTHPPRRHRRARRDPRPDRRRRTVAPVAPAPPDAVARAPAPAVPLCRTASSGSRQPPGPAPRPCPPPRRVPTARGSGPGSRAGSRGTPSARRRAAGSGRARRDRARPRRRRRRPTARRLPSHDVATRRERALDRTKDLRLVVDDQHDGAAHGAAGHRERRTSRRPRACPSPRSLRPSPSRTPCRSRGRAPRPAGATLLQAVERREQQRVVAEVEPWTVIDHQEHDRVALARAP